MSIMMTWNSDFYKCRGLYIEGRNWQ